MKKSSSTNGTMQSNPAATRSASPVRFIGAPREQTFRHEHEHRDHGKEEDDVGKVGEQSGPKL